MKKSACILILIFVFQGILSAQSMKQIQKEKEKSEKQIEYLNNLLKETQSSRSLSTERLGLIQQKISESRRLIRSLNMEVRYLEGQIKGNEERIAELTSDREAMLGMYSKLVYGLWKKRNKTDNLMFIFSSSDINQAYNRFKYFEQIQNYSHRQLDRISQVNDSLVVQNDRLRQNMSRKNTLLADISERNADLNVQQQNENRMIGDFKKKEGEITKKLKAEQKNRERLAKELEKFIRKETKKNTDKTTGTYKMTPAEKIISDDFAKNKGRLPWPVGQGVISEKFGINQDPVYKQIKMTNNGVNITTMKNADVRSVFNGVVSEIILIPGFNNTVIVRHGNYLTVYANLINVSVKKGDKVVTKQNIGRVANDIEKGSVLNFQVWMNTTKMDPELWLAK